MGWEGNSIFQVVIIQGGAGSGLFVYSPSPGFGNLVASITESTSGFDFFGNAVIDGITSYNNAAPFTAVAFFGAIQAFYTAPGAGGPWAQVAQISQGSGDLILSSNRHILSQQEIVGQAGLVVSGGVTDQVTLIGNAAGGNILDVTNTTAGGAAPLLRVTSQAAGDLFHGARVLGDTSSRFVVDTTAGGLVRIRLGPGNAAPDAILYRSAAALLAADPIAFNNAGAAETMQSFTFANSWTQAAGSVVCGYRRIVAPPGEMEVMGSVVVPVGFAANQAMDTAAPAAYQPTHSQSLIAVDTTNNLVVSLIWSLTGVLQFAGPVANTAAGHVLNIPVQRIHLTQ